MGNLYKCLIVDDEHPAHLVLQSHIQHCEELEWAGSAYNGKEALSNVMENNYDVIFLDIEMPLITGIEVMQNLPNRPAVIITTAYDNFAFDAYQHDAVDYLLKPVSFSRFLKSIEKAKRYCKSLSEKVRQDGTMKIRINGEYQTIDLQDIEYIQSIGNYVKLVIKGSSKPLVVYDSLKNMVDKVSSDVFVQIHKSYVVNKTYVQSIMKENVIMKGDINLPLGRKYEMLVSKVFLK